MALNSRRRKKKLLRTLKSICLSVQNVWVWHKLIVFHEFHQANPLEGRKSVRDLIKSMKLFELDLISNFLCYIINFGWFSAIHTHTDERNIWVWNRWLTATIIHFLSFASLCCDIPVAGITFDFGQRQCKIKHNPSIRRNVLCFNKF